MSILKIRENGTLRETIIRPGTFGSHSYKAREYVTLSGGYCNLGYSDNGVSWWQYKYTTSECDDIIIRCEIPENGNGYLCGFRLSGTNQEFSIGIANKVITYKIGDKTTTHAWEAGVHTIGITGDFYAYFDGKINTQLKPTQQAYTGQTTRGYMFVGALSNATTLVSGTALSGLKIYEIIINAHYYATKRDAAHYYAASGQNNTTAYLFETLMVFDEHKAAAMTGSASVGGEVTYGVQLHDLKAITGSGYRDLVALICEDWTEQAASGADPAYTLKNGNDTFVSAFLLKGTDPNASGEVSMPVPANWKHEGESGGVTPPSRPNTFSYIGELIAGRTPKWHLWADNINLGKRVRLFNNKYQFLYNIFMPPSGLQKPCLEVFDGYSNAVSANWPPKIELPQSALSMEFHNSVLCQCGNEQLIAEYVTGGQSISTQDHYRIFRFANTKPISSIKFCLGNLPYWNMTPQEINALTPTGINLIFGMACTVEHAIAGVDSGAYKIIAMAYKQTEQDKGSLPETISKQLMPLSSLSDTATINLMKKGLTADGSAEADYGLYMTGELETLLYRELIQGNISARASLSAIRTSQTYAKTVSGQTVFPTTDGMVFTDNIIGAVNATITGVFNPKSGGGTATAAQSLRSILMTEQLTYNNVTYNVYPVVTAQSDGLTFSTRIAKTNGDIYFAFDFSLFNGDTPVSGTSMTTLRDGIISLIEVTRKDATGDNYGKFVKPIYGTMWGTAKNGVDDPTYTTETPPQMYMATPVSGSSYMPNTAAIQQFAFTVWSKLYTNGASTGNLHFPTQSTVKIWVGYKDSMKPVWHCNSDYVWLPDQWKVDFGSSRGYILIDETNRELAGNSAPLEVDFTSWNSSNAKSAYNVSSARTIRVDGYNGGKSSGEPTFTTLTTITVTSGGTLSGLACSATGGYQAEIVPGGKQLLGPDGTYPTDGVYGYRLRVTPPSGTTWKGLLKVMFL